jgi:hypothetical protein
MKKLILKGAELELDTVQDTRCDFCLENQKNCVESPVEMRNEFECKVVNIVPDGSIETMKVIKGVAYSTLGLKYPWKIEDYGYVTAVQQKNIETKVLYEMKKEPAPYVSTICYDCINQLHTLIQPAPCE